MKIRNISGSNQTFALGRTEAVTLEDYATATDKTKAEYTIAQARLNSEVLDDVMKFQAAGSIAIITPGFGQETLAVQDTPQCVILKLADMATGSPSAAETKYFSILGVLFEFDEDATYTAGRIPVAIDGTSSGTTAASLKAAINASTVLSAQGVVATDVVVVSTTEAYVTVLVPAAIGAIADLVITASATPISVVKVAAATTPVVRALLREYAVTTTSIVVPTGFTTIVSYFVFVRNTNGGLVAYDGYVKKAGGTLVLPNVGASSGVPAVPLANTQVLTVLAFGY